MGKLPPLFVKRSDDRWEATPYGVFIGHLIIIVCATLALSIPLFLIASS